MPRRKSRDYAGEHGRSSSSRSPGAVSEPPYSLLDSGSSPPPPPPPATAGSSALARLVFAADGRYSVNAHSDGTHYHKWRWSLGPFAGRYVMFVASRWQGIDEGFAGLLAKIDAAYEGRLVPTLDRYH